MFLSTLSLRRATCISSIINNVIDGFYPRSPCGERPASHTNLPVQISVSIHALLAESDLGKIDTRRSIQMFLSTLSLRRATVTRVARTPTTVVSIHALLAESDFSHLRGVRKLFKFLSTLSLRRATIVKMRIQVFNTSFYPRSPCGERPPRGRSVLLNNQVSIHALLAESDVGCYVI